MYSTHDKYYCREPKPHAHPVETNFIHIIVKTAVSITNSERFCTRKKSKVNELKCVGDALDTVATGSYSTCWLHEEDHRVN